MRFVLAALLSVKAFTTDISDVEQQFMQWIVEHSRSYGTREEYSFRLREFAAKHQQIEEFNRDLNNTSSMGHNHMSDWTNTEYRRILGYKPELRSRKEFNFKVWPAKNQDSVNWVTAGAVTPVKNQGSCGSCWSFSTTGSMEGSNQIQTGDLIALSEQQFVDCDKGTGDMGCRGGLMDNAFKYAETTFIETEAEYPYKGKKFFGQCEAVASEGVVGVNSFYDVTLDDPSALKAALDNQPVSVAIQADQAVFQHYTGGVVTSDACGTQLDHGVLAVGYGTDDEAGEYYLVKNSWGPSWGLDGYIKLGVAEGKGICGIQSGPPSAPETKVPA